MKNLKAISVRQPWAWLIIHGGKNIENRTWPTKFRGRVMIHASKKFDYDSWIELVQRGMMPKGAPWSEDDFQKGGLVGSVEIVDCVQKSRSKWFAGPYGFVLKDPHPIFTSTDFIPMKGKLGIFEVKFNGK